MLDLAGVLGPVTTPFDARGEIDRRALERNIRGHLDAGLHGIVIGGSTGEAALLDDDERRQLVEWARGVVPAGHPLIAGTGSESTQATIRRTCDAAERGADAVLVVAPHYYGELMTPEALAAHYRRVADASPVPVLLYNIPKYMHFALAPELVAALARHGNIAGIKDSSGKMEQLEGYLGAQGDAFTVLTGNGGTFLAAIERGARGGILAVSLFAGPLAVAVLHAFRGGDVERARRLQTRLGPLSNEIVGRIGIAGIKAALDRIGLAGGAPRSPIPPLDAAGTARVAELLDEVEAAHAA